MSETLLPQEPKNHSYRRLRWIESVMLYIIGFIFIVTWLAGIVLAKGFFSVSLAMCVPFYAQYLVVEKFMQLMGWI